MIRKRGCLLKTINSKFASSGVNCCGYNKPRFVSSSIRLSNSCKTKLERGFNLSVNFSASSFSDSARDLISASFACEDSTRSFAHFAASSCDETNSAAYLLAISSSNCLVSKILLPRSSIICFCCSSIRGSPSFRSRSISLTIVGSTPCLHVILMSTLPLTPLTTGLHGAVVRCETDSADHPEGIKAKTDNNNNRLIFLSYPSHFCFGQY